MAGDDVHLQIVASTADARRFAVVSNGEASWVCGLSKGPLAAPLTPAALEVVAECGGSGQLLPFQRWSWSRQTREISSLRPLSSVRKTEPPPARLVTDVDTEVRRLEVSLQGTWLPVLVDETSTLDEASAEARYGSPGLTTLGRFHEVRGFFRTKDGIVITFANTDAFGLIVVDQAIALSYADVANVGERFARALVKAQARTQALRAQYAASSGVFSLQGSNQRARRRQLVAAVRDALKLWEQARVFGSLATTHLADALWLLAWLEAPTRRQEAIRLYLELRDRDQAGADTIANQLAADPRTRPFGTFLQARRDPLRGLPPVNGCSSGRIAEAALQTVSNDDLLWLHRAQWAAQGGYRFSDPKVQEYFEGFTWYAPIPKDAWRQRATKTLREHPDAPLLKKLGTSTPADACRENLELILKLEQARGLRPPAL